MTNNKGSSTRRARGYPLFWFMAAADEEKLLQCPASEQDKHFGIGLAIIFTAVAAVCSGYFAFVSFLHDWWKALPIAIFWGLLILNLDRILVSSMRKDPHGRWWRELGVATPRILLAVLIAFVITKPIEVEFFRNQLDTKKNSVLQTEVDKEMKHDDSIANALYANVQNYDSQRSSLQTVVSDCGQDAGWIRANGEATRCDSAYRALQGLITNNQNAIRAMYGNSYYSYRDEQNIIRLNQYGINRRNSLNRYINDYRSEQRKLDCDELRKDAAELCKQYMERKGQSYADAIQGYSFHLQKWKDQDSLNNLKRDSLNAVMQDRYSDLFGQLRILQTLKKDDRSMRHTSWLIMALFFTLELAPMLVKIISGRGKYDSMLYVDERKAFDLEQKEIQLSEDDREIVLRSSSENMSNLLAKEKEASDRMIEESIDLNADLGRAIMQKWHEREMKKLNDDPDDYLNAVTT